MSGTSRRLAAWLALAALVFAQLAVSAYACPMAIADPALAETPAGGDAQGCPESNPNLCELHCDYGSSSVSTHAVVHAMPDLAPLPWSPAVIAAGFTSLHAAAGVFPRSNSPPPAPRPTPLRI